MLVLTRKQGQSIMVSTPSGDIIEVIVTRLDRGRQVALGFVANDNIDVYRKELKDFKRYKGPMGVVGLATHPAHCS